MSNTDGVLGKVKDQATYDKLKVICLAWEARCKMTLEYKEYLKTWQKDVNNYIILDAKGGYKSKGSYVKKLKDLEIKSWDEYNI
jgi:hypothetical protein